MNNIIEPDENFDFTKLTLAHPVGIQGGAYFTKIEYNKKPLYIQTTKSKTRQGILKTGKKYYCDLMFDKNSESLINWFENLETHCQKLIFEKKDLWFQGTLEENDIESAFNTTIRIYKSGKFYLLRTNIRNGKDDQPFVKIYDESEIIMGIDDIHIDTEIISILEIQGIKFTSRNFQIEIELKQAMVLKDEPIFNNCLIKTNKSINHSTETTKNINENLSNSNNLNLDNLDLYKTENIISNDTIISSENINNLQDKLNDLETNNMETNNILDFTSNDTSNFETKTDNDNANDLDLKIEFEDLNGYIEENEDELKEMNETELNLEKNEDTLILKKPNQVYFELYKEAKKKAKQAKKNAILAYLEAKNIKKTYMIENINDSDSEFEEEIDAVSESELEEL
jgi:hypothetical protein